MPHPDTLEALLLRRDELRQQLGTIGDFRSGSLQEMRRRCGKPNCRCATDDNARHVSWAIARRIGGKTVYRGVPRDALKETRRLVDEYRRFRALAKELTEVSDRICELRRTTDTPAKPAKKGGSKPRSWRRSRPKPTG